MSFILDALRKSEKQRQSNATPGIADARVGAPRESKGQWKWIVGLLLLLNCALLLTLWLRSESPAPAATGATAPGSKTTQLSSPVQSDAETARTNRRLTNQLPSATPVTTAAPTATQSAPEPTQRITEQTAPANTAINSSRATDTGSLPSLESLQLKGLITLPPQRIDLHVYSDIASERFVFINMKKHREGSQLSDGPVIDEVTPDGVIMTYNGYRFVLTKN